MPGNTTLREFLEECAVDGIDHVHKKQIYDEAGAILNFAAAARSIIDRYPGPSNDLEHRTVTVCEQLLDLGGEWNRQTIRLGRT